MEKASDIPDLAARIAETVRGVMLDLRPRLIEARPGRPVGHQRTGCTWPARLHARDGLIPRRRPPRHRGGRRHLPPPPALRRRPEDGSAWTSAPSASATSPPA